MGCLCFKSKSDRYDSIYTSFIDCELAVNYGTGDADDVTEPGAASESTINYPAMAGPGKLVDICGLKKSKFIIHSGTHYVEVDSLKDEVSISDMKPLREVCRNGDHYLARYNDDETLSESDSGSRLHTHSSEREFYIIKGKSCTVTESLSNKATCCERTFDLHPECQGGSFYFANGDGFYIIRSEENTCLQVEDMSEEGYELNTAIRFDLRKAFANGLYYFATDDYFYVLKGHTKSGLVYHRTKDLRSTKDKKSVRAIGPSIVSLMSRSSLGLTTNQASESECRAHRSNQSQSPYSIKSAENTYVTMSRYAKPTSDNLTVMKWKNKKGKMKTFKLKTSIVDKWRDIGGLVEVPSEQLETWEEMMDDKACCEAVLSHWLDHPPHKYPTTWESLYELLKDCELSQVAAELKRAVKNAI